MSEEEQRRRELTGVFLWSLKRETRGSTAYNNNSGLDVPIYHTGALPSLGEGKV